MSTRLVIIFKDLSDAIYAKIDKQLKLHPGAKIHREDFYNQLLNHYDKHGVIPNFKIERRS